MGCGCSSNKVALKDGVVPTQAEGTCVEGAETINSSEPAEAALMGGKEETPLLPCQVPEEEEMVFSAPDLQVAEDKEAKEAKVEAATAHSRPNQGQIQAEDKAPPVQSEAEETHEVAVNGHSANAEDDTARAAASTAVAQCLQNAEVVGSGYRDSSVAEDDTARAAASLAVAQCLQNAEVAAGYKDTRVVAEDDTARAAASLAVAQCLQNAEVTADGYRDTSVAAEAKDDTARAAALMAVAQCLQNAEVAAHEYNINLEEAQCVAAQHVESWTASILLLQQALAEAGVPTDASMPTRTIDHPILEAEEVHGDSCGVSPQGTEKVDMSEISAALKPMGEEDYYHADDFEERPSTADVKQDDMVSTCDGSRRDPESRLDFWEGSELGRPGSSERPCSVPGSDVRPGTRGSRPDPLHEEEFPENKVLELISGEIGPINESASPCHVVVEEEESDATRMKKEAEKMVREVEAKAQKALKEQQKEESNAMRIRREAEKVVDELEVKAKKALREKHEEQLSATGIRREAERVADEVQEQAQRAVRERCQQSLAIRKEAMRLVDEVEAEARKALREQQARAANIDKVQAQKPQASLNAATAEPDPKTTKLRMEAEKLEAEIRASFTEQQKQDEAARAEATSRALDAQFEALQKSEEDRLEAFQALEATREVVRKGDLAYARAEVSEAARREAEETVKRQENEIQEARRRMQQEAALEKTQAERREALRALEATRQAARKSDDDAKAKWEQMKAKAAEAEREVKEAMEAKNRQAQEKIAEAQSTPQQRTGIGSQAPQEEVKDELERVQAEADHLLAEAQKAHALALEEQERAQQLQLEAKRAEDKAKTAQMQALKCREKLRISQKEADDAERARCEAVLHKIRWRVEARRLEVEEELFSQASIDAERPDQMDAFGVFPPVINHARANVDFALRRVRNKMEAHGLRRVAALNEKCEEKSKSQVQKPETFDQMLQRMRSTWDQRLKVLEGQGWTPGSPRPAARR